MIVKIRPRPGAEGIRHYPTRNPDGSIRRWYHAPWPVSATVDADELAAIERARYLVYELPAQSEAELTLPAEWVSLITLSKRTPRGVGPATLRDRARERGIPVDNNRVPASQAEALL